MSDPRLDSKLARVFATPDGNALLAEQWETLSRAEIEAAVLRERKRWATGRDEPSYTDLRRAWADEIGWPWP